MNKFIGLIAVSLAVLTLSACGGGSSSSESDGRVRQCLASSNTGGSFPLPTVKNICDFNINIANTSGDSDSLAPNQSSSSSSIFLLTFTAACRAPSKPVDVRLDNNINVQFNCKI